MKPSFTWLLLALLFVLGLSGIDLRRRQQHGNTSTAPPCVVVLVLDDFPDNEAAKLSAQLLNRLISIGEIARIARAIHLDSLIP
ncbi:hypothetical protein EHF33_15345 [Deinococcus psychrotolerans]|uniref:Uncharacterized protein n=1 Tax=Deinococcus psychrotolerans TaxID=2489213 RepID=A0A3G8YNS4_9DEIO|nr:hypothetical protein [Deinococcus psychrotolerans]AZI44264.1 hypothetical protein EHF33_15345 [Deinococcus psychrotolerans]